MARSTLTTARFCAASHGRRHWPRLVALALIVGFAGAIVLAAIGGARRSDSAFTRMKEETRAADLRMFGPAAADSVLEQLRAVPGVEEIGKARQLTAAVRDRGFQFLSFGAPLDDRVGRTVERPRLLEGRRPRQDRVGEVAMPEPLAQKLRVGVGDTVKVSTFSPEQVQQLISQGGEPSAPEGPQVPLRVVGITRVPADLAIEGAGGGVMLATRAFVRHYGDQIGSFAPYVLFVRLSDPAAAGRVVRQARTLLAPGGQPGEFQVQPTSEFEGGVEESVGVLTTGLVVFAIVAGLAGLVVVGIGLRRTADDFGGDLPVLRSLGVSRWGRVLTVGLAVVPVALGGAFLAVVGAFAASPLMPLGLAADAEPDPGLHLDGLVLGLGFLAVLLTVVALGLWSAQRVVSISSREPAGEPGSSALARRTVAVGLAPPVTVGVAMTLEPGRGQRGIPARAAVAATVVAVLGVVAVTVFGAGLGALSHTPRAYGYNWDAHTGIGEQALQRPGGACSGLTTALVDDPAVAGASEYCTNSGEVDGHGLTFVAFDRLRDDVGPTVLEGRAPRGPDEIALGTATFDAIAAGIGDNVRLDGPDGAHRFRVVGRVVIPKFPGSGDFQAIADGAVITGRGYRLVAHGDSSTPAIVVRWRPGADVRAAKARLRALPEQVHPFRSSVVPLEVDRLEQVDVLPWVLGGFLAIIGTLGLSYALVTGVRRRARDFATLKTLGFRRRQVAQTVAVQATLLAAVGVAIGVPLGIVIGRLVWDRVADQAGMLAVLTVPALAIGGVAVATVLVANLVAAVPARRAARLRPAVVLRSE